MTPPPDNEELARTLTARLDRFERYAAESLVAWIESKELSLVEVRVVLAMADQEAMSGSQVAERAALTVEMVYPAIHALDARGWIDDQGRTHALSAAGRELVHELAATRDTAVRNYVESLSPAEREQLVVSLAAS